MEILLKITPYFLMSLVIAFLLTPLVKKIGLSLDAYAVENGRTVHKGKIVRIGGVGVFLAFVITMSLLVKTDKTFNAILVGGLIVFLAGLVDDLVDLKPLYKFLLQIVAAVYVVLMGDIQLDVINLGFLHINVGVISIALSIFWIVGVTNAINLIDGLDGLSCGISSIVLCVIGLIGYFMHKTDISIICLILSGAIMGFLPYNFHPAKLFVGDCGALFMGYMIACLSLLGFKSSTFISLGFPIIMLFVPLADTAIAIIRRKIKGQKISEADRSHLHHVLMYKVGLSHEHTVLVLYGITLLFAGDAILMFFNETIGTIVLAILCVFAWIFIELMGMINPKFHPMISLCRKITGHPKKSDDAFFEANKINHRD